MFKVLIVDDEKIVRIALKSIINWNEYGLTVVGGAPEGITALDMVDKLKPDIVITDLKMPKMDGIQLLKALKEKRFRGKVLILSNYGDFELVREALKLGAEDYILKVTFNAEHFAKMMVKIVEKLMAEYESEEKQLQEKIEVNEIKKKIKNDFYKSLLSTSSYIYSEIESEARRAGVNGRFEKSIMLYIIVDNYEKALADSKIKDRRLLILSVQNIIHEILNKIGSFEVIELGHKSVIALLPAEFPEQSGSFFDDMINEISSSISMYLNISCSIVISDVFEGFYSMKKAFNSCERAAELIFYRGFSSVIKVNEINIKDGELLARYNEILDSTLELLQAGELAKLEIKMTEVLESARDNCWPKELKSLMIKLLEDIRMKHFQNNDELYEILEAGKESIANSENLVDAAKKINGLLNDIYNKGIRAGAGKYRKEVYQIMGIVKDNIDRRISLSMIANKINMTESYLCKMFKKETGKNIISFVNDVKIDRAMELLKDNDISIREIAGSVGFDDQFYFYRIFKKYTGISPTEYRSKMNSRKG